MLTKNYFDNFLLCFVDVTGMLVQWLTSDADFWP